MNSPSSPIKVMIIDDSAVVRGMIKRIFEKQDDIDVIHSATNGDLALRALDNVSPDIILLDVEMPVMNGMEALPQILKKSPRSRIVMCSTLTVRNAQITMEALRLGATECLAKPTNPHEIQEGGEFHRALLSTVRALSGANRPAPAAGALQKAPVDHRVPSPKSRSYVLHESLHSYKGRPSLLAIGSSTGGPQALFEVVKNLKNVNLPIILTQHMPATFTKILAQHITNHTGVQAVEAETGMILENDVLYVAPGGYHMKLRKNDLGKAEIFLDDGAPVNFCKPAVDPMLQSAIDLYGNRVLCAILTGMGHDGLNAAKILVEKGGRVVAQNEETSVVWGMPGAVAEAGLCSAVLPLQDIGPWIRKAITG